MGQLANSGRDDVVMAVSERLDLEKAGIKLDGLSEQLISFKGMLDPKRVLELAEMLAVQPTEREWKKRSKKGGVARRRPTQRPLVRSEAFGPLSLGEHP